MKKFLFAVFAAVFLLVAGNPEKGSAQCAMCTLNADESVSNGQTEGKGLNRAVLVLLAAPYVAVGAIGYIWYKKYRRKNVTLNIKSKKISLN